VVTSRTRYVALCAPSEQPGHQCAGVVAIGIILRTERCVQIRLFPSDFAPVSERGHGQAAGSIYLNDSSVLTMDYVNFMAVSFTKPQS
jgi:hypothetical protein